MASSAEPRFLRVWRLCKRAHSAFDGEGSRLAGGRWNRRGTRMIYTSGSLSLAALEILVHCEPSLLPADLVAIPADSFARVSARLRDPAEIAKIRKDLPIYIFVGDKDPINQDLELLKPLVARYRDAGLKDLEVKVYPGGRHEMLNETNRAEVVANLTAWLERVAG